MLKNKRLTFIHSTMTFEILFLNNIYRQNKEQKEKGKSHSKHVANASSLSQVGGNEMHNVYLSLPSLYSFV